MTVAGLFHFVSVGTTPELIRNLWNPLADGSEFRFSHIVHPRFNRKSWPASSSGSDEYFFTDGETQLPVADRALLLSLERKGIPTIHNMILSDRVVSALPYERALGYATLLAKRLMQLFAQISPGAVIGGFDAIHGSMALAVARKMGIPWYALHFSVIPEGLACFCDNASPAARVLLDIAPCGQTEALAARSLQQFESREIVAPAYIAHRPRSILERIAKLSSRTATLCRILRAGRDQGILQYTEPRTKYDGAAAVRYLWRAARARKAVTRHAVAERPPASPYILFGLHMQPESSIDVWAPFYSNQIWVIELLSRSIPPTHKLLVKIHKSDTANYSGRELRKMCSYPGVELVEPFADTRSLMENADLIVLIQGTMGLEAALIGKPVIMLGESPFTLFPSVAPVGAIVELPDLIRKKLEERSPPRSSILKAYAEYLRPFAPASTNDWSRKVGTAEADDYRRLFDSLRQNIVANEL
jgi:hypothetical protein